MLLKKMLVLAVTTAMTFAPVSAVKIKESFKKAADAAKTKKGAGLIVTATAAAVILADAKRSQPADISFATHLGNVLKAAVTNPASQPVIALALAGATVTDLALLSTHVKGEYFSVESKYDKADKKHKAALIVLENATKAEEELG